MRSLSISIFLLCSILTGCNQKKEKPQNVTIETEPEEYLDSLGAPNADTLIDNNNAVAIENGKSVVLLPTMESDFGNVNAVYCSNMAYLWNELMKVADKKISKNNLIYSLENSTTWRNTLDTSKLVQAYGPPDNAYESIIKQFKLKYGIDNSSLEKQGDTFWAYSFYGINFKYDVPFNNQPMYFLNKRVHGFGLESGLESSYEKDFYKNQIQILYFNYEGEYIVKLIPAHTKDEIILVMPKKKETFKKMFLKAQSLIKKGKGEKKTKSMNYSLNADDELLIPVINFRALKEYDELEGIKFSSKYTSIVNAQQEINFNFDEKGVVMESNFAVVDSIGPPTKPKYIHFSKPFYLFIKRIDAEYPYFNLWIDNNGILEEEKRNN